MSAPDIGNPPTPLTASRAASRLLEACEQRIAALEAENARLRELHGVLPEEIQAQRERNWAAFHPETYCHKCGGRNVRSWYAPSHIWNTVDGGYSHGILCPSCFAALAKDAGFDVTWSFCPEEYDERMDLRAQLHEAKEAHRKDWQELERLREAIEKAPHWYRCAAVGRQGKILWLDYNDDELIQYADRCNCWKALAGKEE